MPDPETPAPILITGAGRNVGAHLARRLMADGRPVIVHYRTPTADVDALTAAGAATVQGDLDSAAGIHAVAVAVAAAAPRLGGIVHNASAFARTPDDTDDATADFERYWAVHMLAPWLLDRLLGPRLTGTAQRPADIVYITDIYADNPAPDFDVYCATKAGLQNLALSTAKRLAPAVKANVIQPGPIDFTEWHSEDDRDTILAGTPLGRTGGPEAIYRALRGILDNDYLTGAVIPVDGGRRLGR